MYASINKYVYIVSCGHNSTNLHRPSNLHIHIHIHSSIPIQQVKTILDKHPDDVSNHYQQHVLCSIKIFKDGLIEVSPSLSTIVEENPNEDLNSDMVQQRPLAMSAFIEDKTVETALKKGFRLSTFRVVTEAGNEFEFAIQNLNELLIPYKIEEQMRMKDQQDAIVASENRGVPGEGIEVIVIFLLFLFLSCCFFLAFFPPLFIYF